MKKMLCILGAFVMLMPFFLASSIAENDCTHSLQYPTGQYEYEYEYWGLGLHNETQFPIYRCAYCPFVGRMLTSGTTTVKRSCTTSDSITVTGHGKDSSKHWDICYVTTTCTKCFNSSTQTNVIRNEENHIEGDAVDAGHSGTVHYFERYCDRSFCRQFMIRFSVLARAETVM